MAGDERSTVELLYKVSREVATAIELRVVLQRLLFAAINNVGGERGSIIVLDESARPIDAAIVYGKQVHENTAHQLRETVERGLAGWVVRNRQGALVPDTSKDERWLRREDDAIDRSGAKSAICVPLLAREKLVGVLTLVHPVPRAYAEEHFSLMQAIADQVGVVILNARLYAESQRQARVMTALAEGAVSMNASLRLDEVFQRILLQTKQALQVDIALIGLVESPGEELVYRAAIGEPAGAIVGRRIPLGQGITGLVLREGRGVVIPSVTQDSRFTTEDGFTNIAVHSLAVAPIHVQGRVIGVIEAINPVNKTFDPDALLVLTGIGSLAGTTLQNAQLYERLDAAQKRYRELFEDSINPIIITDEDGRIIEINRRVGDLSGYTSDQLRGHPIDKLHDVNRERTGGVLELITSDTTCTYESTLHHENGQTTPVEVYARKVEFENAESIQWIFRDISERRELDSLREDLTAMIYHDLRSPLANIVSSLDILASVLSADENESIGSIMSIARHSIGRIQRLLSSLLDIGRLESGKVAVQRQAVALASLRDDIMQAVKPGADGRKQEISLEIPESLPRVPIDVDMIRRVLINLTENAIKFTPSGGKIALTAESDGRQVRVTVVDNGPGIPTGERERIFEKFARIKSEGGPSGLGVGLAFCRLAVIAHGGRIWVESEPGQGSRFIFTLPVE